MSIRIEPHTMQRALERGATESEIIITLKTGFDLTAKKGRLGKGKIFDFNAERNGVF